MAEISGNLLAVLDLLVIVISVVSTYLAISTPTYMIQQQPDQSTGIVRLNIESPASVVQESGTVKLTILPSEGEK